MLNIHWNFRAHSENAAPTLPATSDGGAIDSGLPELPGEVGGSIALSIAPQRFTHGRTTKMPVKIERLGGFAGDVTVTLKNLPTGIVAKDIVIAAGATEGQLDVIVPANVAQGDISGARAFAMSSDGKRKIEKPLTAMVRVFLVNSIPPSGTAGIVDPTSFSEELSIAADNSFYVGDQGTRIRLYDPNGALDTGFATNGVLDGASYRRSSSGGEYTNLASGSGFVTRALKTGRGYVLLGFEPTRPDWIGRRNLADGSPDASFGTGGSKRLPCKASSDLSIDSKGRLVAAGIQARTDGTTTACVTRIMPDGAIDSSFVAGKGYAKTDAKALRGLVAVQPDGKVLHALSLSNNGNGRCTGTRYQENGELDSTFGSGGRATPSVENCLAAQIDIQPDGRILMAGTHIMRFWD